MYSRHSLKTPVKMLSKTLPVLLSLIALGQCAHIFATNPPPPAPEEAAKMARYILRYSDYLSVGTTSIIEAIKGYPFVMLKSVSEGTAENSTGIPYLYMTEMDLAMQDVLVDSRCTVMASLAQLDYCKEQEYDAQDPRCAKVMLTGRMVKVDEESPENEFAKEALFAKHPAMIDWPTDHMFFVAKIEIEHVAVLDYMGGVKYATVDEYFAANEPDTYYKY